MHLSIDISETEASISLHLVAAHPQSDDRCFGLVKWLFENKGVHEPPPRPNEAALAIVSSQVPDPIPWRVRVSEDAQLAEHFGRFAEAALGFAEAVKVELNPQPIPPGRTRPVGD